MADINTQQIQDALDNLSRTTNALGAAESAVAAEHARNEIALKRAAMSLQSLSGALLSSDRSLGKYSNSVSLAADAAASVANNFGHLGQTAGFLIKIFGSLVSAGLKQHDGLIKTYRTLSNFGALNVDSSIDGIEQLKDQLKDIGATYENSAYFAKLIGDIAPDLISLSGDVGKGKDAIVEMTRTLLDTEENRLKNLGYTTESIAETGARFTATQARLGISQGDLAKNSAKYMTILAELSALTGVSRDKQQELLEAQTKDVAWRAHLAGLAPEEQEATMSAINAMSSISPAFGEAAKEMLAMGGGFRTQATAMVANQFPEIFRVMQDSIKKELAGGRADLEVYQGVRRNADAINTATSSLFGTVKLMDQSSANQLGVTYLTMDSLEKIKKLKTDEEMKAFLDGLRKTSKDQEGRMAIQTEEERKQRARDRLQADAQFGATNTLLPALSKFTELVNDAAFGVARFVKAVTGGTVDWTENFRQFNSIKDTQDALKVYGEKEAKLKQDRIKVEEELNILLKRRSTQESDSSVTQNDKNKLNADIKSAEIRQGQILSSLQAVESSKKTARSAQKNLAIQSGTTDTTGNIIGSGLALDERLSGLRKVRLSGDTHREGAELDPRLIAAAQQLENNLPELSMITSFNDDYHKRNRPGSKHVLGQAIDFTLKNPPTPEEFKVISEKLKKFGFTGLIKDEYNKPDDNTKGRHIHAELATGGIISGPKTGYPAMLHGTEAVIPMNMFKDFGNLITKLPLLSGTGTNNNNEMNELIKVMDTISTKIDEMVNYQRRSVSTQEEILTFTRH